MRSYLDNRVILEGEFIVKTKSTIRATATFFKLGKSTVHKDVVHRLKYLDLDLYNKVREILNVNLNERHIRGGLATKEKFKIQKQVISECLNK
ncbi:MAG: sporulation transcriptional regulator SpoIIID [Clostridia bacterium]|nr:sporulation transcriptional regulator SpoIIID [Clostridia bacterium]